MRQFMACQEISITWQEKHSHTRVDKLFDAQRNFRMEGQGKVVIADPCLKEVAKNVQRTRLRRDVIHEPFK
jgi:hypothetical protein